MVKVHEAPSTAAAASTSTACQPAFFKVHPKRAKKLQGFIEQNQKDLERVRKELLITEGFEGLSLFAQEALLIKHIQTLQDLRDGKILPPTPRPILVVRR